jgi:hypothetical protein
VFNEAIQSAYCYTFVHSLINYVISGFLCINEIFINPTKKIPAMRGLDFVVGSKH